MVVDMLPLSVILYSFDAKYLWALEYFMSTRLQLLFLIYFKFKKNSSSSFQPHLILTFSKCASIWV